MQLNTGPKEIHQINPSIPYKATCPLLGFPPAAAGRQKMHLGQS